MSKRLNRVERIRQFCLSLEDAKEVIQFGYPFYKWRDKPFAIYSDDQGEQLSIKVEKESQAVFLEDPRFCITPYVGRHGWINLKLAGKIDWEEVEELIRGSYQFVKTKSGKAKKRQNNS